MEGEKEIFGGRHHAGRKRTKRARRSVDSLKGDFSGFFLFMCDSQHCFYCRPSDSTVSEDAGVGTQDSGDYGIGCQTL
jgi:hypothetical protein